MTFPQVFDHLFDPSHIADELSCARNDNQKDESLEADGKAFSSRREGRVEVAGGRPSGSENLDADERR